MGGRLFCILLSHYFSQKGQKQNYNKKDKTEDADNQTPNTATVCNLGGFIRFLYPTLNEKLVHRGGLNGSNDAQRKANEQCRAT